MVDPTLPPTTGPAPVECGGGAVTCFQPVMFALDTVVPIIDLDQRNTWHAIDTGYQIWFNLATAIGWALSTIAALSFTKLARSDST